MLLLTFCVGTERYAIDSGQVVEITPMVRIKRLPLAEAYVAGVINYRGHPSPVVDLCQLLEQRPCAARMSTRIILVRFEAADGQSHVLGMIAEQVTEAVKRDQRDFEDPGIRVRNAPFLRAVCSDARGMIQLIDTARLLPRELAETLFDGNLTAVQAGGAA